MIVDKEFYIDLATIPKEGREKRTLTKLELGEIKHFISLPDSNIDDILDLLNTMLSGYGVESISSEKIYVDKYWMSTVLLYINFGDTYNKSVCYDTREDLLFVGSWGDWAENNDI